MIDADFVASAQEAGDAVTLDPAAPLVLLRQADGASLYRAAGDASAAPLLLAVCVDGQSRSIVQRRMDHAYSFRHRLDGSFATVPLRLTRRGGLPAMLLSDPGGLPLHARLGRPLALASLLAIGIGIARALACMHARDIIHKDLRPCNILVDAADQVFLTGFGGASLVSREAPPADAALEMADSLPYISPEQTGRINRSVDTRSDLYAFGVTLYEMATGVLPFQAADAMEWVHCHVAREAVAPAVAVPAVPKAVSNIVMRLLSKAADERYQTAAGVEADLQHCARALARCGGVDDFALGFLDIPDRLLVAEELYGREAQIAGLHAAHGRVLATGRTELVLVSGYSGIGKSTVVGELRKSLVAQKAPFAAGKFEQHKRDIPYSTVAQALRSLVADVLRKDVPGLAAWRTRLVDALGVNGQIVVNLVPELTHVIGMQPALPEVPASEGRLRFQQTVCRFLGAFASEEHPLVLFIDDLQWLDAATLELLSALAMQRDFRNVLLVGAYRSNEVDSGHPLAAMRDRLREAGAPVSELALEPLGERDLEALVARTLRDTQGRSAALAGLIREKTQGNPFFVSQFIMALGEQKLLRFDHTALCWQWDIAGIRARNYSDNVADLMAEKLTRLPQATRRNLILLACLGASASVQMLSRVSGLPTADVHVGLAMAEHAGLVSRRAGGYRFMHDRIQEAAYELLPLAERAAMHLDIGRRMWRRAAPSEVEPMVFELLHQFARGTDMLSSDGERREVAALYLLAARRAVSETAYASALSYLSSGERLLPADVWEVDYRLAFDLSRARAECEFLVGDPVAADARLGLLAARAGDLLDKAGVTSLQVTVCLGLDQSARAIATCLAFLHEAGMAWPLHPGRDEVAREYASLVQRMEGRPVVSLLALPPMVDPLRRAILDVLAAVLPPAFFSDENLVCLVLCRMARLSIDDGNADASPLAYAYLGMMAGPYFGDYETAFQFGKLGFDLVEQGVFTRYKARVYMCFSYHVIPWARAVRSGQALLRRAFHVSRESGDITYAGFSSCCLVSSLLVSGDPLDLVHREAQERLEFVTAARFGLIVDIITSQQRLVATLQGRTAAFGSFNGADFDECRFEQHLSENRSLDIAACWYWIRKAQARFLAGDATGAYRSIANAAPLLWTSKGHLEFAEYHFHGGLIRAACCEGVNDEERTAHLAALDAHRALVDDWAQHCPDNFLCRSALLSAESARLRGDDLGAMRHYESAIASARKSAFPHDEALACELSSRFHASRGLHAVADGLIRAARLAYERWGATGKTVQLDQTHAHLREEFATARAADPGRQLGTVDLATLLRISQAVTAEKGLGNLMRTLMTIALEHAGAQRGLLVLPSGGQLRIEARATTVQRRVDVVVKSSEATADRLPLSVLHFAIRTKAHVLIDDAREPGPFSADTYLQHSGARSVLCLPLVKQGELIGLLHLENTLAGRVFTPERVAMLTLLASTAATSMENAALEEKESLLQEVHHRVKNNLQLVSSLLSLQASRIADPAVAELFADSRNRVRSMALVHENLYRAGNFARVPMAAHIRNLCAQLTRAYGTDERQVVLTSCSDDIQLGLNRAVSCGLIVNELVSNALKHAFPGQRVGRIQVSLRATQEGRYALSVSDDGVGLHADVEVGRADSLGLQLVDDLTHQLHGEVEVCRDRGTAFVVTFDADAEPRSAA